MNLSPFDNMQPKPNSRHQYFSILQTNTNSANKNIYIKDQAKQSRQVFQDSSFKNQNQDLLQIILMLKIQITRLKTDNQIQSSQKIKLQIQDLQQRFEAQRVQRKQQKQHFYDQMKEVISQNEFLTSTNEQIKSYCQQLQIQNIQLQTQLRQSHKHQNQIKSLKMQIQAKEVQQKQLIQIKNKEQNQRKFSLNKLRQDYNRILSDLKQNLSKLQVTQSKLKKRQNDFEQLKVISCSQKQFLINQVAQLQSKNIGLFERFRSQQNSARGLQSMKNSLERELNNYCNQINTLNEQIQQLNANMLVKQEKLKEQQEFKKHIHILQFQIEQICEQKLILQEKNNKIQRNHQILQQQALSIQQKNTAIIKQLQSLKLQFKNIQRLYKQMEEQNKTFQEYKVQSNKEHNSLKQVILRQQKIIQGKYSKQISKQKQNKNIFKQEVSITNSQCGQCHHKNHIVVESDEKYKFKRHLRSNTLKNQHSENENQKLNQHYKEYRHKSLQKTGSYQNLQNYKQNTSQSKPFKYQYNVPNQQLKSQSYRDKALNCQYNAYNYQYKAHSQIEKVQLKSSNNFHSFLQKQKQKNKQVDITYSMPHQYLRKSQQKNYKSSDNFAKANYSSSYRHQSYMKDSQPLREMEQCPNLLFNHNNQDKEFLFLKLNKGRAFDPNNANCRDQNDTIHQFYPIQSALTQRNKTFRQSPYQACFSQRYNMLKIGTKVKEEGLTLNRKKQTKQKNNKQNVSTTISKKCEGLLHKNF